MATVEETLKLAATHLGYTEGPDNETPFGAWAGTQNLAWCHAFVSKILHDVGESIGRIAWVPSGVVHFRNAEQLFAKPKAGDVFYVYHPKKGRYGHCGFVKAVDGNRIVTIEGNSNSEGSAEGHSVVSLKRTWAGTRTVFGRPSYDDKAVPFAVGPVELPPIVGTLEPPEGGVVLVGDNGAAYAFFGAQYPGPQPDVRQHDPVRLSPIVDEKKAPNERGGWLLGQDGGVYAFGAPALGCPHGQPYWTQGGNREAARLDVPGDGGAAYTVVATSGERYTYR
ncbi:MAG TPA: CHAP domain-containing protein [Acidimicrobiales bacterium]|nr:CHAP domain-containing protein [Acidimicrobiales bacterium]